MEIEDSVIQRIRERQAVGFSKYGVTVAGSKLTQAQWLRHAQEEALDLAIYLERTIRDLEEVRRVCEDAIANPEHEARERWLAETILEVLKGAK